MAFYKIEPFGEYRADVRAGIVASVIANVNLPKNAKPYATEDFMPKWKGGEPKEYERIQTDDDVAIAICNIFGVPEDKWPDSVKESANKSKV